SEVFGTLDNGAFLGAGSSRFDMLTALSNAEGRSASGPSVTITANSTVTFYNDVINEPGASFGVDIGSSAIFLGNVNGISGFSGGGSKLYAASASGGAAVSTGS